MAANNPLPGIRWEHLSDACVEGAIDRLGFQFPVNHAVYTASRQGRQQFLADLGIAPWQCLPLPALPTTAPAPTVAPVAPPKPPELNKQQKQESTRDFLGRLDGYFMVVPTAATDQAKLQYLFGAAGPALANFVTTLMQQGVTDYATVRQRALERFEPSFVNHLHHFQQARKQPRETFLEFGYRLRQSYLGYLQQTESDITPPQEPAVTKALICQLMTTIFPSARQHMDTVLVQQPDISWHEFLQQLESFAASRRPPSFPQQQGNSGVSNASGAGSGHQPPWRPRLANGAQGPPRCFTCNRVGHRAADCPQTQRQGN